MTISWNNRKILYFQTQKFRLDLNDIKILSDYLNQTYFILFVSYNGYLDENLIL